MKTEKAGTIIETIHGGITDAAGIFMILNNSGEFILAGSSGGGKSSSSTKPTA